MNNKELIIKTFNEIYDIRLGAKGKGKGKGFDLSIAVKTKDKDRYLELLRQNEKSLITYCILVQKKIEIEHKQRLSLSDVSADLVPYISHKFYDEKN